MFPDAAAVVTHAGHGTIMRALAHGIPLLCLPMGRDQDDNAARVFAQREVSHLLFGVVRATGAVTAPTRKKSTIAAMTVTAV